VSECTTSQSKDKKFIQSANTLSTYQVAIKLARELAYTRIAGKLQNFNVTHTQ